MRALLIAFCLQRSSRTQFERELRELESAGVETISLILGPSPRSHNIGLFSTGGVPMFSPTLPPQKKIKTVNEARRVYLKLYKECFARLPYKRYDLIIYYGHGGGVRVGAWRGLSPALSIKEFVEPFTHHNIHGRIMITEACYLATLSAASEMYKIAPYLLGTNNFYSGEGALQLGEFLRDLATPGGSEDRLISGVDALVNAYHQLPRIPKYHCFVLLRTRHIPKLLRYLRGHNVLSTAAWDDLSPVNRHDRFLYKLRDFGDERLNEIIDEIVVPLPSNPCEVQDLTIEKYAYCVPSHRHDTVTGAMFNSLSKDDRKHSLTRCNR